MCGFPAVCQNNTCMQTKKKKTKKVEPIQVNATTKKRKFLNLRMPKSSDHFLHAAMIILMLFGIIMVGSASMGVAGGNNRFLVITIVKQVVYAVAGYTAMTFLANHFQLKKLKSSTTFLVILATIASLLLCLLFTETNGARAWIRIPLGVTEVTLQPSEFAKIIAILVVALYLGDNLHSYSKKFDLIKRPLFIDGVILFIVWILQSDFGSMAVIFVIICVCFLVPNHPQLRGYQRILTILFYGVVLLGFYILSPSGEHLIMKMTFLKTYQIKRFVSAINPFMDQYGTGYQLISGLISFATGGWFGKGLGNSVRKYTNFPAASTDYILAIVVEELGFVGFIGLLAVYGFIIFVLLRYALKMRSEKGRIILVGTAMYFLVHMFFNIGGVTGLIPLTGVPLLMVSAGGSSTMSIMACVGISQAVIASYRRGEIR